MDALLPSFRLPKKNNLIILHEAFSGYTIGYISSFAGYIFWEIIHGRQEQFLDKNNWFRIISYVMLLLILTLGLIIIIGKIFVSTSWIFNIGAILAGISVTLGLEPFVNYIEKNSSTS